MKRSLERMISRSPRAAGLVLSLCIGLVGIPSLHAADPIDPGPAATSKADDAMNLQPDFVAGRVSKYEVRTVIDQITPGERSLVKSGLDVKTQISWTIENVAGDGAATCVMVFEKITAEVHGPDGKATTFDASHDKAQAPSEKTWQTMIGAPIKFQVARDGTLTSVSGVEAIRKKLPERSLALPDDELLEIASQLALVPGGPEDAHVGTSWLTSEMRQRLDRKVQYDTRWSVNNVEQIAGIPIVTLTGVAKIKAEPKPSNPSVAPPPPPGQVGPKTEPQLPNPSVRIVADEMKITVMFDLERGEAAGRQTKETIQVETQDPQTKAVRLSTISQERTVLRISEKP